MNLPISICRLNRPFSLHVVLYREHRNYYHAPFLRVFRLIWFEEFFLILEQLVEFIKFHSIILRENVVIIEVRECCRERLK